MVQNAVFLVNPSSDSGAVCNYLESKGDTVVVCKGMHVIPKLLQDLTKQGVFIFTLCGGDGTINNFLNSFMVLDNKIRKKICLGIIPCGRANDLARSLHIPFSINEAYQIIQRKKRKKIDVIQVNEKYFVTGGGFGLPAEVVEDLSQRKRMLGNVLKDLLYYGYVIKRVILTYKGVKVKRINDQVMAGDYMFLSVSNQAFIGKRFLLSPNSVHDDGFFEVCLLPKPQNAFQSFLRVQQVISGEHVRLKQCLYKKQKKLTLELYGNQWFMADGELLEYGKEFDFKIMPGVLSVYC